MECGWKMEEVTLTRLNCVFSSPFKELLLTTLWLLTPPRLMRIIVTNVKIVGMSVRAGRYLNILIKVPDIWCKKK